ncbi:two-component regulator propeller domain-containing protein [Spirosoma telluris]|uniref:ligand-binding sensor domain-containing protein n=1 Tax=Spirosoma telluris TaxID=2183553 RepID=UPI002FC2EF3D
MLRFLYLLFLPLTLYAQSTHHTVKGWQELTISEGLSQGMVFDIKQDHNGFVWVATKDGLNRFDGHNFTVFTHDPYNEYSLSNNSASALLIDSKGRLWIGTLNGGLNLFDERTQRFYHIAITDQSAPNAGNFEVVRLAEDPEGNIWVNTSNYKLYRFTLPDQFKTHFPDSPTFRASFKRMDIPFTQTNDGLFYIRFEPNGQGVLGMTRGRYQFNWRQMNAVVPIHPLNPYDPNDIFTSQTSGAESWFLASRDHVHAWYKGAHKVIHLPHEGSSSTILQFLDDSTVAIADLNYLWLMSPAQLVAQDSLTARNAFAAMPPNLFSYKVILKDKTGLIWIGTAGYGLRVFNPRTKQFGALLANTSLSYLYQDRQGRTYALNVFQYKQIDPVGNRLRAFLEPNLTLPQYQHRYLMQDQQGNFWMALAITAQNQQILMKFSPDWKLLNQYPLPDATRFGNFGNRILEDKTGRLWIGATSGKLVLFDPRQETFRVLSYQHLMPQSGTATETYALYFDQAATLWIGTQYGLIKAESSLTNPRFTRYKNSPTDRQSLSNDFISCVLDDPFLPNRYLWISTKGGGLDRLDKQSGHFQHFTEKEGLPNKVVYGLLLDEYKQIWLSTNRGLAQFNPKTFRFRNYTKVDGLQDDEFNTGSYVKAPTGELLFGGVNGLNHFRASQVAPTHGPVPQAHLIGLKVNNEPVLVGAQNGILTQSLESTERIELAHNQNLVTVEFGVMDFTNPAGNRYRYKLQGIDQDWVEAGTNRFANYAQLPDGTYTLQMMGSADGVVWSQPVTLQIQVHPPFYRTWWAYLFYLLVLAVLGWQVYRFQLQRAILQQKVVFEQTQSQRLAELDALKTQFFANISHEFRTPLTLILGPLADLKQRFPLESVLGMMERNASRLLSLINQLLDLSKLEVNQLKPEPTNGELAAFLRTVASSFESLARSLAIQFIFTQDKTVYWASFDRDKLEKIISNLLSNAFKFTPANQSVQMTAQFQEDYNRLVIKVQDTGIGIAPHHLAHIFERFYQVDRNSNRSYEGTGIGLALVNELVTVLGGTITVESTEGAVLLFR